MKSCENCLNNNWKFRTAGEIVNDKKHKWIKATCNVCGNEVEFGHKILPIRNVTAEYEIRKGKRFLKIDGKFTEVGLYKFPKFWRVMPVDKNEWIKVKPNLKNKAVRIGK